MKTFSNQVDLTAHFEGFHAKAYKCPAGVWTIGYGATSWDGKPIEEGMVITEEQAKDFLSRSIQWLYKRMCDIAPLPLDMVIGLGEKGQAARYALADYAYNCGRKAFPTLLKHLKEGNIELASQEFLDGIYVNKKPLMGLLLRRISEYNTFTTGRYEAFELNDPISESIKSLLLLKNGHNDLAVEMINKLEVKD